MEAESEIIEGEVVNPNGRALAVRSDGAVVDVEHALTEWEAYQTLTQKLLNDSDYQKIGRDRFKKKSAWRKYARAFNVSCEQTHEEIIRADDGFPLYARVWVRASDPSGRYQEADHECHVTERCCPRRLGKDEYCKKASWQSHTCCKVECDGRIHFSHPGDLPATATTRAKNRAISDLIGAGEVSADEMEETGADAEEPTPAPTRAAPRKAAPASGERKMQAKYKGECYLCGNAINVGDNMIFMLANKKAKHDPPCVEEPPAGRVPDSDNMDMPAEDGVPIPEEPA